MKKKTLTYHRYPKEVADDYGIPIAALLQHFSFWYKKVQSKDHQYFEGDYWVRMKLKSLHNYFSYLSEDQLWRLLNKMSRLSLLKKGEFNDKKGDRTKWYTLTEKSKDILLINTCKITNSRARKIANSRDCETANSIYQEEDKIKEDIYRSAMTFLMKLNPIELELWIKQNKPYISDFDRFLEYYEIVVQQEELNFTYNKLFGRLKKLRFNWKTNKAIDKQQETMPIKKYKRIG